ncbi:MAG: hypothetical protein K6G86_04200 [Bacteroidales bacterium]|nr:hypothetical protein [Bacteroidales bacterium]
MDWDVLIPILMFAFPVAVAILDKRVKKRRGVPPVQSRPIFPPATSGSEARPEKRPAAPDPSQPFGWAPPSYGAEGGTVSPGRLPNTTNWSQADRIGRSSEESVSWDESLNRTQQAEQQTNTLAPQPVAEGQRTISRERHQEVAPDKKDPEPKLRIDKKNLILYSEILKPKFDA